MRFALNGEKTGRKKGLCKREARKWLRSHKTEGQPPRVMKGLAFAL